MGEEPNPDDEADEAVFEELLKKKGKPWLTELLTELGITTAPKPGDPPKPSLPNPASGDALSSFLTTALGEEKAARRSLREKLDAVMDILTPEQRQALKSANADPADPAKPKPKNPPKPKDDPPPPAPKPSWRRKPLPKL